MKTIGICTGCYRIVQPGPYFQRRMKRHLNDSSLQHNHDAFKMVRWDGEAPRYLDVRVSLFELENNLGLAKKKARCESERQMARNGNHSAPGSERTPKDRTRTQTTIR